MTILEIIYLIVYLILILLIGLLAWTFIGYPLFLILGSPMLKKAHKVSNSYFPKVTFMIMTYNEEKAILKKLENSIDIDYPHEKLEIFVVDSASTDKTQDLTRKFINDYYKKNKNDKFKKDKLTIKLIAQPKREGKASGINYGLNYASNESEIIVITDGNAMLNKESIRNLAKHFYDEKVGGVCGRFEARDTKGTSVGSGGSIYWQIEKLLRQGESNIDSCIHMSGEITGFRKGIINELDTSQLAEDFDMAVTIRKKGFRIIYEPEAIAHEPAPTNITDLKMQKKRITIGTLQVLSKYKTMLFNPKYGWYGFMILPSHKLFQLLTPFFLFLIFLFTLILFFLENNIIIIALLSIEILMILLTMLSFAITSLTSISFFSQSRILNFIKYFVASNYIVVLGWLDFLQGKKIVTWKKIESSREF